MRDLINSGNGTIGKYYSMFIRFTDESIKESRKYARDHNAESIVDIAIQYNEETKEFTNEDFFGRLGFKGV
jgi:uncharacterized protein YbjQ (UPF0145 family)